MKVKRWATGMSEDIRPNNDKDPIIFKLSGRCFDKGLMIEKCERFVRNRVKTIYSLDIDLETNPEFLDCDFKDNIELFLKENNKIIFRGAIKDAIVEGNKARILAVDISLKLDYVSIVGFEASPFLSIRDIASLLISPVEELRVGNTPDIPDTSLRYFIIIVPIKNLILKEGCNIGNVELYKDFNTIDDKIIKRSNTGEKVLEWNGYQTRAKVIVKASEFRTALIIGYGEISTACDIIALRNDLSFPRLKIRESEIYMPFHYQELVAQVRIPTWAYCRECDTEIYAITNLNFLKENVLDLDKGQLNYFDTIDQIFSKLLCKNDKTQHEKRLLMALHWLRRSIQDGDNKDKMLDLWTAMEFVMTGTKSSQLFSDGQMDSITQLIDSNRDSLSLTDIQYDALIKKINALNDAPLMARIYALKEQLSIKLSDDEMELIDAARNKRNKINHGKDIDIYDRELNKLRSIIERLLIGKISLLDNLTK